MEEKQRELQTAFTAMIDKIERERVRPMQKAMHLKMAECYNNAKITVEDIQRCEQAASLPVQRTQNIMQRELDQVQDRIQRCVMACNDDVRDKYRTQEAQQSREAENAMIKCSSICVDKHIAMIKGIKYDIERAIDEAKR